MKNRSHPMKTFFKINLRDIIFVGAVLLILWLLPACRGTKNVPKPEPYAEIVSSDPGILIYPDDPFRVLKICDSLHQIVLIRNQATRDSLLNIIEAQRSLIFTLKEQLEPARGAK